MAEIGELVGLFFRAVLGLMFMLAPGVIFWLAAGGIAVAVRRACRSTSLRKSESLV